jgi:hypothetical protein
MFRLSAVGVVTDAEGNVVACAVLHKRRGVRIHTGVKRFRATNTPDYVVSPEVYGEDVHELFDGLEISNVMVDADAKARLNDARRAHPYKAPSLLRVLMACLQRQMTSMLDEAAAASKPLRPYLVVHKWDPTYLVELYKHFLHFEPRYQAELGPSWGVDDDLPKQMTLMW